MERLYTPSKAGELLGGLHPNDVRKLWQTGKLRTVVQICRGTGKRPRRYVPASAIEKYIAGLGDGRKAEPERPAKASRAKRGLRAEVAKCVEYV